MNKNKSLYSTCKSAMCGYSYKDLLQFTPTHRSQHPPTSTLHKHTITMMSGIHLVTSTILQQTINEVF